MLLLPLLLQALLGRLVEPEEHALAEGLAALAAVTGAVPLEELALHLDFVRSCLAALLSDAEKHELFFLSAAQRPMHK